MKIVFICGSLETGKDGVGDYTRRLCGELINQGLSVGIMSYNDKHVNGVVEENQISDGNSIPCLRIANSFSRKERCNLAKNWIEEKKPEWLSLQFVPYAFNNKGLPFGLSKELVKIGGTSKWHIMIHELWIGMNTESPSKAKLIGYVQKNIIKKILSSLKPIVINTQTELYKNQLMKLGHNATILPLFSNIPNTTASKEPNVVEGFKIPSNYMVLFGSIHTHAPIDDFIKELKLINSNPSLSLVTIGRNGAELKKWISICKTNNLDVLEMGEQPVKVISHVIKHAKYGISTTPIDLIQKSGAMAAMHEHGLPVICISKPWTPIGIDSVTNIKGVTNYKLGHIKKCIDNKERFNPEGISLSSIGSLFIEKLKNPK